MSRIKHCAFCGEPQKQEPCETCGADEEKIHKEMLEREDRRTFAPTPSEDNNDIQQG